MAELHVEISGWGLGPNQDEDVMFEFTLPERLLRENPLAPRNRLLRDFYYVMALIGICDADQPDASDNDA